jgi:hypothetical protein
LSTPDLVFRKEQIIKRLDAIIKQYQDRQDEAERLHSWGNMAYWEGQKSAIMKLKWEIEVYW